MTNLSLFGNFLRRFAWLDLVFIFIEQRPHHTIHRWTAEELLLGIEALTPTPSGTILDDFLRRALLFGKEKAINVGAARQRQIMDGAIGRNSMKTPNVYSKNQVFLQPVVKETATTIPSGSRAFTSRWRTTHLPCHPLHIMLHTSRRSRRPRYGQALGDAVLGNMSAM